MDFEVFFIVICLCCVIGGNCVMGMINDVVYKDIIFNLYFDYSV